jgi:Family of unknown function (DUF6174)
MMIEICYPRGIKNIIAVCIMVVLVGSLSSCILFDAYRCAPGYSRPNVGVLKTQLTRQKEIWASKNLKSYSYSDQGLGYEPTNFPLRVTVTNGTVTSVTAIQIPGQPKPNWTEPINKTSYLMESHFYELDANLSYTETQSCGMFSADYDASYGFPKRTEYGNVEQGLADATSGFTIFDFTVTP